MPRYSIHIHGIYIAPQHKVFGKKDENIEGDDIHSLDTATLIADSGIQGDRFCRHRPDYNGHLTFFSLEVWDAVSNSLELSDTKSPRILRRNIVISGVDLKSLYNQPFEIQGIRLMGTAHCAPCLAINRVLGPGAREALRSRGGLRAQIKSNGLIQTGPSALVCESHFDPQNAASQTPLPRLP